MRSNAEWVHWGRTDPLWAVASWRGRERGSADEWSVDEFLALGRSDFDDVWSHWTHYGVRRGCCIEIGCGAGRMTAQLVRHFDSVIAVDVSADQITLARQLLGPDVPRVRFEVVTEPRIPVGAESCTGMFSCHVFQHMSDFGAIEDYLRLTFDALEPGGTICFHVPVPGAHRDAEHSRAWFWTRNFKIAVMRRLGRLAIMEYRRYAASDVLNALDRIGFSRCELRVFAMRSNADPHSFFFAQKP